MNSQHIELTYIKADLTEQTGHLESVYQAIWNETDGLRRKRARGKKRSGKLERDLSGFA